MAARESELGSADGKALGMRESSVSVSAAASSSCVWIRISTPSNTFFCVADTDTEPRYVGPGSEIRLTRFLGGDKSSMDSTRIVDAATESTKVFVR